MMTANEKKVLRELAQEYAHLASDPIHEERRKLHTAVNDLKMIRPVVMLDEIPWNEMNFNGELTLQCEDWYLRLVEEKLRRKIFQQKYFPADTILRPYLDIGKVINSTGIGVKIDEDIIVHDKDNYIVSHEYKD
ncbi:MAG: hypothetical protein IJE77_08460, partial [Thermoguttaceae bacterium]|nr:hypothetical protein [Thermoguttaceae bacterium]